MRTLFILGVCAIALTASGCAVIERLDSEMNPPPPTTVETDMDPAAEALARQEAAIRRARETERDRQAELKAARPVPQPGYKPEIVRPESLVGLDRESATSLFGPPHFISNEAPATVWFYRGSNCVMRLFFYPDLSSNQLRTLTYEFTSLDSEDPSQHVEICASGLRWAHAASTR